MREIILVVLIVAAVLLFVWGMVMQVREFRQDMQEEAEYHAWAESRGVNQLPRRR